jgi:hypothetical protein
MYLDIDSNTSMRYSLRFRTTYLSFTSYSAVLSVNAILYSDLENLGFLLTPLSSYRLLLHIYPELSLLFWKQIGSHFLLRIC